MLKIVVFDSGWGGELCANYIEQELGVAEIKRVIDWRNFPYISKTREEICRLAEKSLKPHIGKSDAIVIASNVASVTALPFLKTKYPEQRFIDVPLVFSHLNLNKVNELVTLGVSTVFCAKKYRKELSNLKLDFNFTAISCDNWLKYLEDGILSERQIMEKLRGIKAPDVITLECTHLIDIKEQLEKMFGWRTQIFDARELLLYKICEELKLKGARVMRLSSMFRD